MEIVTLDKFIPRPYQLPICDALENKGYRKILYVLPRRAGKDVTAWNLIIRAALMKVGVYLYCLPTYDQSDSVIWSSITNESQRFIDFIPPQVIAKVNQTKMKVTLKNNSIIKLVGSDNWTKSIVGQNARMVVFSEYGTSDDNAYTLGAEPMLRGNDGVVVMFGTPRGKNHFYEQYIRAKNSDQWFVHFQTVNETKHMSVEQIQEDIRKGEISEDKALQEYFCSWDYGQDGAYYAKYIDKLRLNGRITDVPWDPSVKVHTSWDLGYNDSTSIIFYQVRGSAIHVIDFYQNNFKAADHYCKLIQSKDYIFGKHFVGQDIMVHDLGTGLTRYDAFKSLGVKFELKDGKSATPAVTIQDGIEKVRNVFPRLLIDSRNCKDLVKCLEYYHQEFDPIRKIYRGKPQHDWSSHAADAMRYLALTVDRVKEGTTKEEWNKHYQDAYYGDQSHMPAVFRTDLPKS